MMVYPDPLVNKATHAYTASRNQALNAATSGSFKVPEISKSHSSLSIKGAGGKETLSTHMER
jgi:hypothetical protein